METGDAHSLKSCLSQGFDFVVVRYDAWQCFKNWYGCEVEIERKIMRVVDDNNIVLEQLDLYPKSKRGHYFST